jgi:hypothetical protein
MLSVRWVLTLVFFENTISSLSWLLPHMERWAEDPGHRPPSLTKRQEQHGLIVRTKEAAAACERRVSSVGVRERHVVARESGMCGLEGRRGTVLSGCKAQASR